MSKNPNSCADPLAGAKKYKFVNKCAYSVRAKLMTRDFIYKNIDGKLRKGKKGQYLVRGHNGYMWKLDKEEFKDFFVEDK